MVKHLRSDCKIVGSMTVMKILIRCSDRETLNTILWTIKSSGSQNLSRMDHAYIVLRSHVDKHVQICMIITHRISSASVRMVCLQDDGNHDHAYYLPRVVFDPSLIFSSKSLNSLSESLFFNRLDF